MREHRKATRPPNDAPTQVGTLHAELVEELDDGLGLGRGSLDRLRRHAAAEPVEVRRDHAPMLHERGRRLLPVLERAEAEAMEQHDGWALPAVEVTHLARRQRDVPIVQTKMLEAMLEEEAIEVDRVAANEAESKDEADEAHAEGDVVITRLRPVRLC